MKTTLNTAWCVTLLATAGHCWGADTHSVRFGELKAGTYRADPYHTQVVFSLLHFGFSNYYGMFAGASGTLHLDPAKPADSKLDISIQTESLSTTVPILTQELKGDQWFDVQKFPTATFVSTKVVPTGAGSVRVTGTLTLHGVTRPVVLTARLVGAGTNPLDKAYTVGFEASGTIKRGDFGISMDLPDVGDEVTLRIAGAFEAAK